MINYQHYGLIYMIIRNNLDKIEYYCQKLPLNDGEIIIKCLIMTQLILKSFLIEYKDEEILKIIKSFFKANKQIEMVKGFKNLEIQKIISKTKKKRGRPRKTLEK